MLIATWNVNSVKVRLPQLSAWLQKAQPDVVCLQEIKCETESFPFDALGELGYEAAAYGQKTYNGVALLSKLPIENIVEGFPGEEGQSRLIEGTINGITVLSCYAPNGQAIGSDKFAYKLRFYEALRKHLDGLGKSTLPLVIAGDFNIAPDERDVFDVKKCAGDIGFHPDEHKALKRFTDWGLVDSFRLHEKGAGHFSWWDYRTGYDNNQGMRIDQVWISKALEKQCTGARIDIGPRKLEKPSDHTPVLCELDV